MTPFWTSRCGLVSTFVGDALDILRQMPDDSVHCCVTSPPYYGLRDYGTASWEGGDVDCEHAGPKQRTMENCNENTTGAKILKVPTMPFGETCGKCGATRIDQQIGLEKTPAEFIAKLVEVFREVRRVLHPSGTAWVNMGDSYNSRPDQRSVSDKAGYKQETNGGSVGVPSRNVDCCKPKDLIGIPWMLAFALRDDGWTLRQDIIWAKPSPMPESVIDRCTKSHEYVFLLTKNPIYFYDAEAIKEPASGTRTWATQKFKCNDITRHHSSTTAGDTVVYGGTKNRRSVWNVASAPYAEAHFATYPPELIRPMIRAGTSEKGVCQKCLAPWVRVTEKTKLKRERPNEYVKRKGDKGTGNSCGNKVAGVSVNTKGWEPSCKCAAGKPIPATVIDIFGGSGTTGMVARQECRRCIMIELNPKYAALHRSRVEMIATMKDGEYAPLFNE